MKTITILSGKGGVGKSSISASLSTVLSEKYKIIAVDCDVDASNLALVFGKSEADFKEWNFISTNKKAVFDLKKCNSCGLCVKTCYFNAINWKNNKPLLKPFSCEGCKACEIVCPTGAITMKSVLNAKIGHVETKYDFKVVSAQLLPGESGSGKLVSEVKKKAINLADDGTKFMIIDSAAGIGCPVIASVVGSDYCILVIEPTQSSLSDAKRVLEIINHFNIPVGIIINKFDINKKIFKNIEEFAKIKNIKIIEKIPYNKNFTNALVEMVPIIEIDKNIKKIFNNIAEKLFFLIFLIL